MKKKLKKLVNDKPMLKLSDLALLGLIFIHSIDNMTILLLLASTVSKIAKIGIAIYLLTSNLLIYIILKKFGKVWK